jgi:[ribosomal protein S18]-alanine N-acetyltransferase
VAGTRGPIEIRPMQEEDLDAVLAVERLSFPTPWTRDNFLYDLLENPHARNLVAWQGDEFAGYACFWVLDSEAKLNNIAVDTWARRRGVGARLLREVVEAGRREGCSAVTLEVRPSNASAIALYRRFGFVEVGRRKGYYQDTGEDAILMNLGLSEGGSEAGGSVAPAVGGGV